MRVGLTTLLLVAGAQSVHNATADGDTRELTFHHTHSDEDLTVTFKRNGRYDEGALKKLNRFLRDWRSQDETTMDRRLFDIIWEVYRDVDGKQPIQIISAYRSPATNAMLRRRSSGVARFSQHMQGHAMDFFIPGIPLEQIRFAGLRLQRGGVGFYPTSGSPFVHLDVGSIRYWPRMSRDQLVKVFPDGRTVYLPSDGKPMPGYELAMADIAKRGDGTEEPGKPSLLAGLLFHKHADDEEEAAPEPAKPGLKAKTAAAVEAVVAKAEKIAEAIPLPRSKPAAAAAYQVASVTEPQTVAVSGSSTPVVERKPNSPVDVINARGFWDNEQVVKPAAPAQTATQNARAVVASADPREPATVGTNVSDALAYAPVPSPIDKSRIVASAGPVERSTIAPDANVNFPAKMLRLASSEMSELWLRAMILAPSASRSLSAAILGDQDMTGMRTHFVKPKMSLAMTFSNDPQMGLICERFTGSATVLLQTTSFGMRTAELR